MPYLIEEHIDNLITLSLTEDEIKDNVEQQNLNITELVHSLKENIDTIKSIAVTDILEYDNLENQINEIEIKNPDYLTDEAKQKVDNKEANAGGIMSLFIFSLIIYGLAYLIHVATASHEKPFLQSKGWLYTFLGLSFGLVIFIVNYIVAYRKQSKWKKKYNSIILDNTLDLKKSKLLSTYEQINERLVRDAITPMLRQLINEKLSDQYEITLPKINAPGLSEVVSKRQTIDTAPKKKLDYLLHTMPGGSIGIAGSRGAGKSTLIQNYCGNERNIENIGDRKILPVFTTAPVQYDPREFILHLYASTCRSLLNEMKAIEDDDLEVINTSVNTFDISKHPIIKRFANACLLMGLFLLLGVCALNITQSLTRLNIQSDKYISLGMGLLFLAFFTMILRSDIPVTELLTNIKRIIRLPFTKKEKKMTEIIDDESVTIKLTRKALNDMKFQRSFTSGWSGSLKMPIGFDGNISSATTLASKQMSNPEIVYEFIKFVNQIIPKEYIIIIGIDEMDKLDSDEQAQRFLNEIKSIFGLNRCFYLISVSENAMSNFERRGLPFRDVFDSSFDAILYVDYLNLEESKSLLSKRVIGKHIPFFDLAYCISGGLARDLIRIFRQIVERSHNTVLRDMPHISSCIIQSEIHSKVRAINYLVKKVESLQEADEMFDILSHLEENIISPTELAKQINALLAWQTNTKMTLFSKKTDNTKEVLMQYEALLLLSEELSTYLVLMLTVLEYFIEPANLYESALKEAENNGTFKTFAKARQVFSLDSGLTRKIVSEFRTQKGLFTFNL